MSLSRDQVKHIAKLSRLNLTDAEIDKYGAQLSHVLEYISQLNEIDTSSVEPTVNTTGLINVVRDDIAQESLSREQALANAAEQNEGFFVVPNVFD